LNDIKTENCLNKIIMTTMTRNLKMKKKTKNHFSDVKFVNISNLRSFKYASMFINKTFNNFMKRRLIYDFDCNNHLFII
jgi:hypothetical protein